jgi:hypothetical protein
VRLDVHQRFVATQPAAAAIDDPGIAMTAAARDRFLR